MTENACSKMLIYVPYIGLCGSVVRSGLYLFSQFNLIVSSNFILGSPLRLRDLVINGPFVTTQVMPYSILAGLMNSREAATSILGLRNREDNL